jgi:hypothetical protein
MSCCICAWAVSRATPPHSWFPMISHNFSHAPVQVRSLQAHGWRVQDPRRAGAVRPGPEGQGGCCQGEHCCPSRQQLLQSQRRCCAVSAYNHSTCPGYLVTGWTCRMGTVNQLGQSRVVHAEVAAVGGCSAAPCWVFLSLVCRQALTSAYRACGPHASTASNTLVAAVLACMLVVCIEPDEVGATVKWCAGCLTSGTGKALCIKLPCASTINLLLNDVLCCAVCR